MDKVKRDYTIDFLRGIAVFAMILIHTSYYFLSNPTALFIWNYAQFAVPVFVFCSAYLFFRKPFVMTNESFGAYLKKRLVRLFLPYYIFLVIFVFLNHFKDPNTVTLKYIFDSIIVWGGVEIDWLVLLFLQFALLMPLLSFLLEKYRKVFWGYAALSLASTMYLFFITPHVNYRWIMWLPWSLLCIFAVLFYQFEKKRWFYPVTLLITSSIYIFGNILKHAANQSPSLFDNKYPPNLYFMTFGIAGILVLILLSRNKYIPQRIRSVIHFLSIYSYSLYFIHYIVLHLSLYILPKYPFTWYTFFALVIIPSMMIQWGYIKITEKMKKNTAV